MADYGEAICASCGSSFVKKSHNARYCSGDCKRDQSNIYYRRTDPPTPKNFQEPAWPVIKPGPPVKITHPKVKTKKQDSQWSHAVILPDIQIGFYRDKLGNVYPTQDENAISIARQVLRDVNPDQVVIIGDTLDLPEFSLKYRLSPQFIQTTQASIDRVTVLMGELRSDAPNAKIFYLSGNHEKRLSHYLLDNAKAAFGLRRGCEPEGWPVLSIPNLCRLDEVGVHYYPSYPADAHWINDRLRVIHGVKVSSVGSTVHKYLNDEWVSTIFGHIHRREAAERTKATRDGSRTILAASPGCLCATNGRVPSTRGGIDENGVPAPTTENWQAGFAVVSYQPGDSPFVYEVVPIFQDVETYWAMYHGKEYSTITI